MSRPNIDFLDDSFRPASGGRGKKDRGGKIVAGALLAAAAKGSHRPSDGKGSVGKGGARVGARDKLARVTKKTPEVMVKVSGRQKGGTHTAAHLEYIARHGKLEVETNDGQTIKNVAELRELAREWTDDELASTKRREPLTSVSMVMSMPPGTDPEKLQQAVRAFARVELEPFKYAMALHTDEAHPHVHLTVAARGEGGVRFHPTKPDLALWRESFARELRARGIEAEATPRRARGIVQKPEQIAVRKIRERSATGGEPPQVMRDSQATARSMAKESPAKPRPWEVQAFVKQAAIRESYTNAAALLDGSDNQADRDLARQTRAFVAAMPSPVTRDRAQAQLIAQASRSEKPKARDDQEQVQPTQAPSRPQEPTRTRAADQGATGPKANRKRPSEPERER